jgi:4-hydroxybenzoate polyprenyltransferase
LRKAVASVLRTGQWWDHKLVPILCGFYATALYCGVPVTALWSTALLFLLSLIPGAAFVSIVNDLTDIRSDAAAGKANRMAGRTPLFRALALAAAMAAGLPFFWAWRHQPLAAALYGAAWLAFALYSVPPARLKGRGLAGLFADAAGAHLFPILLGAALVFEAAGRSIAPAWMAAIGLWAFAAGCRGNLWHQLLDREGDEAAGVGTFAARCSPAAAARTAALAFAVELAALAVLLAAAGSVLPFLAALYYLLLTWRRVRVWELAIVVARPQGDYRIWLDDYYGVLLPLSLLAASALRAPADLLAIALHLLLFPRRPIETVRESWKLVGRPFLGRIGVLGLTG